MQLEKVGMQVGLLREKGHIARKELSWGLCTESQLALIESGERTAGLPMLAALLERLGKSSERLTYVLTSERYRQFMEREDIEELLHFGEFDEAEKKIEAHREAALKEKDRLELMYAEKMEGILLMERYFWSTAFTQKEYDACEMEIHVKNRSAQAVLSCVAQHFEKAIAATIYLSDLMDGTLIRQLDADERFLSMFEIENILLYLDVCERMGRKTAGKELLECCKRYLERQMNDLELRAQYLAKVGMLLGACYLKEKEYEKCVTVLEEILKINREQGMFVCVHPLLGQIIFAAEQLGDAEKAIFYRKHQENFRQMFEEYKIPMDSVNKLYQSCCLRQYFVEGELISAERRRKKLTQEKLAEGIYRNTENLSRVESGSGNAVRTKFYQLMERLEIDKTRYNGNLITDEYQVLELEREIEQCIAKRQYKAAAEKIGLLEQSVDMNEKGNRQYVLGLKNMAAYRSETISVQEALERAQTLLTMTYPWNEEETPEKRYPRIPFHNEMFLFNQVCILLRKDGRLSEAVEKMIRMVHTYDCVIEKKKFHFRNLHLCTVNLCKGLIRLKRFEEAEHYADETLKEKFVIRKLTLMNEFCAIKYDVAVWRKESREKCRRWLESSYLLSEWCMCGEYAEKVKLELEKLDSI